MGVLKNIATLQSSAVGVNPVVQDSVGTEVGQMCTAWVNFNGTTATIVDSFNVASVTRTTTGEFLITFATSMANINYVVSGSCDTNSPTVGNPCILQTKAASAAVGSISVISKHASSPTTALEVSYNHVAIFGGK